MKLLLLESLPGEKGESKSIQWHGAQVAFVLLLLVFAGSLFSGTVLAEKEAPVAPEFTHSRSADWVSSKPLKLADLKGRVVLVHFWTFDCWNCYRSIPWLNELEKQFADDGLQVVGVHSPEFEHERDRKRLEAKITQFKVSHPVMMDNDFSYWKAMKNRYWPAYYILDKESRIRGRFVGETHVGDRQAKAISALISRLITD